MKQLQQLFTKFIHHEFITGSFFVFLGSFTNNIFSFIFNLFLARSLTTADYGIYASIISLTVLVGIPAQSIATAIMKFGTEYVSKKEFEKAHALYIHATYFTLGLGLSGLLGFVAFSPFLSHFLKINSILFLVLGGIFLALGYIGIVNISFLQSLLRFRFLSFLGGITSILKLLFGVIFVLIGWRVGGALGAVILATVISYILSFIPLQTVFKAHEKGVISLKPILSYALPMSLAIIAASSFTYMDVLLVKHFFSPHDAGLYAGLSLVGKVIFYFTLPIPSVMFPILVKNVHTGKRTETVFYLSLLLVLVPSILISGIYFVIPQLAIKLFLGGGSYLVLSPLLGFEGIYLTIFSILNIVINFFLSIHNTKIAIPIVIASLAQIIGIFLFHQSLFEVLAVSIVIVLVLLITLLLYYLHGKAQKNV